MEYTVLVGLHKIFLISTSYKVKSKPTSPEVVEGSDLQGATLSFLALKGTDLHPSSHPESGLPCD